MDMKKYLKSLTLQERRAFANAAGTSYEYLKQIAGSYRRPSAEMAISLERAAQGKLHRSELRPDLWEPESRVQRRAS